MFADVYTAYPLESPFTYKIPDGMNVEFGKRVKVNFAGRDIIAFVVNVHEVSPKEFKPKDIIEVIDEKPIFNNELFKISQFISNNYFSSIGEALSLALPSGKKPSSRYKISIEKNNFKSKILSDEQNGVYNKIIESYKKNSLYHLIFGITGSGKTEVYIEVAKYFLKMNKSVIYLVPEISLSSQLFRRLYNVFSDELIIYHSGLTGNQRLYHWYKFLNGEAKIVIGTRSSVFLQCPDLGAIIVDEEHDGSYKENSTPRYNAKRIAFERCRDNNAVLLMGSATPAFESLYSAEKGMFELHKLKERYGDAALPDIEIIEVSSGNPEKIISPILSVKTKNVIENKKQAIFLLNRRGFSPFVVCNSCGTIVECSACNISMNLHKNGKLLCHYCGDSRWMPEKCEECGSEDIVKLGAGTQRVEEIIKNTFNGYNIFRLDQDSSRKKGTVPELISKMEKNEINILIGTQMVAKGFDFPGVSLVGVLLADIGLNMPDFRASERIFSLLVQVAGRAGRGNSKGVVLIQTLNKDNDIFKYLKNHDYYNFYRSELEIRKAMGYPPFKRLARLLMRGEDENNVHKSIDKLKKILNENLKHIEENGIEILGPATAPISKIANNYRSHIIIKSDSQEKLKRLISISKRSFNFKKIYLEIDIDPIDML